MHDDNHHHNLDIDSHHVDSYNEHYSG